MASRGRVASDPERTKDDEAVGGKTRVEGERDGYKECEVGWQWRGRWVGGVLEQYAVVKAAVYGPKVRRAVVGYE